MSKHTPGPLEYKKQYNGSIDLFGNGTVIATGLRLMNQDTNIKLIVEAPKLYRLLDYMVNNIGQPMCLETRDTFNEAKALINKLKE